MLWLNFLFLSPDLLINGAVKDHSLWQYGIYQAFMSLKVTCMFNVYYYTLEEFWTVYQITISVTYSFCHTVYSQIVLHQIHSIQLQQVAFWAHNIHLTSIWNYHILVVSMPQAKTVYLDNIPITFISNLDMVTLHSSNHSHTLPSSTMIHHPSWHQVLNQTPEPVKDFHVMTHHGKDMKFPRAVMVDLKWSLHHMSQNKNHHLQAHLKCLQHHLESIHSCGAHLPALLYQGLLLTYMRDPLSACKAKDFCQQLNHRKLMSQGFQPCPPVPANSYDNHHVDEERNDLLNLGSVEVTAPSSLTQTVLSLKQYIARMGQLNNSVFNKLKKVQVAWLQETMHQGIMLEWDYLKQQQDR